MTRRRRPKTAMERMLDEAQLAGFIAKFDGVCHKCREDYFAKQSRIVPVPGRPDRYMHVTCASGFSDE